jgi:y4mF family transcriptional regulator
VKYAFPAKNRNYKLHLVKICARKRVFETMISICWKIDQYAVDSKPELIYGANMPAHTIGSTADLGKLIRRQRKRQRIRQADLAAMIGASHVFLRDVERGKPTVQFGRVLQLLDELGITLSADVPDDEAPLR